MPYKKADLSTVDWSKASFPLGIKCQGGTNPWLELDYMDLKLLEDALMRKVDGVVLAQVSDGLRQLAGWCEAAIAWADKNGVTPV